MIPQMETIETPKLSYTPVSCQDNEEYEIQKEEGKEKQIKEINIQNVEKTQSNHSDPKDPEASDSLVL